jgi:hypothetical protein
MNNLPTWLPEKICVDGAFDEVVGRLYSIFYRDFIERHPRLCDMKVWHDRKIKPGETYEDGFWHLVERDHENQGIRTFDPRRAERLPWCAPVLSNSDKPQIKYWICEEKNRLICYVWLEDHDYVVILEKRNLPSRMINGIQRPSVTIAYLKTAYHVDGDSRRRYFRKKYEKRIC